MFGEEVSYYSEKSYEPELEELKKVKPENVKCPDCDGPMVSRTGKFGVFWGCKAFPACKGTRESMGRSKADREKWKAEQLEKEEEPTGRSSFWERELNVPSDGSNDKFSFKKKQ